MELGGCSPDFLMGSGFGGKAMPTPHKRSRPLAGGVGLLSLLSLKG